MLTKLGSLLVMLSWGPLAAFTAVYFIQGGNIEIGCQVVDPNQIVDGKDLDRSQSSMIAETVGAANAGDIASIMKLARMYEEGTLLERNFHKSLRLYIAAAQMDHVPAQLKLADYYGRRFFTPVHDYEKAYFWAAEATANGSAEAKYVLAKYVEQGLGVEADKEKAASLMFEAAEAGFPDAMLVAAKYYKDGTFTERDEEKHLSLITKAAEAGEADSMIKLAVHHMNPHNLNADLQEAYFWARVATRFGKVRAMSIIDSRTDELSEQQKSAADLRAASWQPLQVN